MQRFAIAFFLVWTVAHGATAGETSFVDLFDGQTLNGWTQRNGTASYKPVDGTIEGTTSVGSPNSFLCSNKRYGNFELLFEVKVDEGLNSGVQIRSQTKNDDPNERVNGPQVEIESTGSDGCEAGYIYGEAAGGWMTPEEDRTPHKYFNDGQWNSYRVLADGPNIKVWINGHQVSDLTDPEKFQSHPSGFIGLQVHGIGKNQGPFKVAWRNIKIREL